ncbi:MAG: nitrilase-related carbon-nitrogen hydrolase, partial [Longimicrobiales bacterium]
MMTPCSFQLAACSARRGVDHRAAGKADAMRPPRVADGPCPRRWGCVGDSPRGNAMTSTAVVTTVNVAVVQAGAVLFDTAACVDKAVRLIGEAAGTGARVIVFPEAFIP